MARIFQMKIDQSSKHFIPPKVIILGQMISFFLKELLRRIEIKLDNGLITNDLEKNLNNFN